MQSTALETMAALLECAIVEHQHADLTASLEQATLDVETRERLEALGSR